MRAPSRISHEADTDDALAANFAADSFPSTSKSTKRSARSLGERPNYNEPSSAEEAEEEEAEDDDEAVATDGGKGKGKARETEIVQTVRYFLFSANRPLLTLGFRRPADSWSATARRHLRAPEDGARAGHQGPRSRVRRHRPAEASGGGHRRYPLQAQPSHVGDATKRSLRLPHLPSPQRRAQALGCRRHAVELRAQPQSPLSHRQQPALATEG